MASESFVVEHHRRLDDGESCESPQTIDAYAVENLASSSSGPFFPSRIVNPHPTMTTTTTLHSLAPRSTVVLVYNHPHPVDVECQSSSSYFPCSASKFGNIMMIASATVADADDDPPFLGATLHGHSRVQSSASGGCRMPILFFIFSMFGLKIWEYHDDCICHCCRCCA